MKVNPSSLALVALMCISTDAREYFDPVTGSSTFPVDLAEESWEAKFARLRWERLLHNKRFALLMAFGKPLNWSDRGSSWVWVNGMGTRLTGVTART